MRYQGPTDLRLSVGPDAVRDGKLRIWISREFLEAIEVERIEPEPAAVELGADRQIYVFDAPRLRGETLVVLRYEPGLRFARVTARIGMDGGQGLEFWQFVYP